MTKNSNQKFDQDLEEIINEDATYLKCPNCSSTVTNYHRQGEYNVRCVELTFFVCGKCYTQFGVNTKNIPKEMVIPKKYMWWKPSYWDGAPMICEVGHTMSGGGHGKEAFIFPTEEELRSVVSFFSNISNNCPMLNTDWINQGQSIDTWEWYTNCKLFETEQEAQKDAEEEL